MPNWKESMEQTFEYYEVDPGTWKDTRQINTIEKSKITRDSEAETLGSASIDATDLIGESYIRVYLVTLQNGIKERFPLGTFLVQTPSTNFNGKVQSVSIDAYTPLLELKENQPPIGYYIAKNDNIMANAYRIIREQARAPVVGTECSETLYSDFVANTDDTWLTFLSDLVTNAKYAIDLDELGRIIFSPKQDLESLQPVWTYDDDNSSILYPEISLDRDLYGVPNVVEVIYSDGNDYFFVREVNDDSNSPTSTVSRGREIVHRVTNPELTGSSTEKQIQEYAKKLLKNLSSVEYTVSYTHGYCPVRVGDCVRLNYTRSGIKDIKAKVISQSISCEPGCPVSEKAIFTKSLWG